MSLDPVISSRLLNVGKSRSNQKTNHQLFAYQDRNNNKILDTGNLQDDTNSEKFYVYPDSLILRTNWELEIEDWEINQ